MSKSWKSSPEWCMNVVQDMGHLMDHLVSLGSLVVLDCSALPLMAIGKSLANYLVGGVVPMCLGKMTW